MYFQETPPYGQYTYDVLVGKFITLSNQFKDVFVLSEWHIDGSSRLGIQKPNALNSYAQLTSAKAGTGRELVHVEFSGSWSEYEVNYADTHYTTVTTYQMSYQYYSLTRGEKNYELVNHLGNVLVVISDKKLKTCTGDTVNYYTADVVQANDYYAFHATMSGRTYAADTSNKYRFGGSNGQEKDDEIFAGAYSAEFWEYDSRSGRRWNIDPETGTFPWQSPYATFDNNPIVIKDPKGLAGDKATGDDTKKQNRENRRFRRLDARLKEKYKDDEAKYKFELARLGSKKRYGSASQSDGLQNNLSKEGQTVTTTGQNFQEGHDNRKSIVDGGESKSPAGTTTEYGKPGEDGGNPIVINTTVTNGQEVMVRVTSMSGYRVDMYINGTLVTSFTEVPQPDVAPGTDPQQAVHKWGTEYKVVPANTGSSTPQNIVITFRTVYTNAGAKVHYVAYPVPSTISEAKVATMLPASNLPSVPPIPKRYMY